MLNVISELFKQKKINRAELLKEEQFGENKAYKICDHGDFRGAYYFEEYDIYVSTSYGIDGIIIFIEKLLKYAKVRNDEVKVSFKA